MKKSQLIKIIREVIKEQSTNSSAGDDLCKQCNPHLWPNGGTTAMGAWVSSWTNLGPFNNQTNPNQPCSFICNKLQTWQTKCSSTSNPQHKNQLGCKIDFATGLGNAHGCNC